MKQGALRALLHEQIRWVRIFWSSMNVHESGLDRKSVV